MPRKLSGRLPPPPYYLTVVFENSSLFVGCVAGGAGCISIPVWFPLIIEEYVKRVLLRENVRKKALPRLGD